MNAAANQPMQGHVAVVGAGWAGLSAAHRLAQAGQRVTLIEAAHQLGGRARRLNIQAPNGTHWALDNGQHILIGAYRATLALLEDLGLDPRTLVHALPLSMPQPEGKGLRPPAWAQAMPAPADSLVAMMAHGEWSWRDRWAWLRTALGWRLSGFTCPDHVTVAQCCAGVPVSVMDDLIEPLCVSALNLGSQQASARVFLRVLRDALNGPGGCGFKPAQLLLPRCDLGALLPDRGQQHLLANGHQIKLGVRVTDVQQHPSRWRLGLSDGSALDADQVVWATSAPVAGDAMRVVAPTWAHQARAMQHTAIATVYAWAPGVRLSEPMLALPAAGAAPGTVAQFAFDRGQLQGPSCEGVVALVVSDSQGDRQSLEHSVLAHARSALRLPQLQAIQTVVEKRATFACVPGLLRPPPQIAPGLVAAGDYISSPYPATIEGAVRSGQNAAALLQGKDLAWA